MATRSRCTFKIPTYESHDYAVTLIEELHSDVILGTAATPDFGQTSLFRSLKRPRASPTSLKPRPQIRDQGSFFFFLFVFVNAGGGGVGDGVLSPATPGLI